MNRGKILSKIHNHFEICACRFQKATGGIRCKIDTDYKKGKTPEELTHKLAKIYYDHFAIGFFYTAYTTMSVSNSILECLVFTDKTDDSIAIPLPFVTDYLNRDITAPLSIPLITNEKCMEEAFDTLGAVINEIFDELSQLCLDSYKCEKLEDYFIAGMRDIYGIEDYDYNMLTYSDYRLLTLRLTTDGYFCYLKGDTKKAVKKLEKEKKLSSYDKRTLRLWKEGAQVDKASLANIIENTSSCNDSGIAGSNGKEFLSIFLSWLVLTPFICAFYIGFYLLLSHMEGKNSVYLMGPSTSLGFCLSFAFITSIAASYFSRNLSYRIIYKKQFIRYAELDSIVNGGGSDRVMHVFLYLIVAASIILCILLTKWNVNFRDDGFIDNTEFLSVKGTYYEYSDVERVYYKKDRKNDFGATLDFPSYVLVMKDGREIDFYEFDEIKNYEETLIPLLERNGVKIEK